MKKFLKFVLGVGTAIAAIGGIMYFLKNVLMKDYLDDFDDDDFDNDLYDEDNSENRDYVTINVPDKEEDDLPDDAMQNDRSQDDSFDETEPEEEPGEDAEENEQN